MSVKIMNKTFLAASASLPNPSSKYTGTISQTTLKKGSKGEPVKLWQKFLNWYCNINLKIDGIFGSQTELYTKTFQKSEGLIIDGIAGPKTYAKAKAYLITSNSNTIPKTINNKMKVIDVSYIQKTIDWNQVKKDNVHGAIIRCGYRGYGSGKLQEDSKFILHITGAYKAGLAVGVYFFTEAINAKEGKEEAQYVLKLLKKAGIKLSFPIAIDTENINAKNPIPRANSNKLSTAKRTEAIKAFCEEIKANGYEPMIYASTSWLENQLNMSKLPYKVWVAQYSDKVTYKGEYIMWQYSSVGKVKGISGNVDVNKIYFTPSIK